MHSAYKNTQTPLASSDLLLKTSQDYLHAAKIWQSAHKIDETLQNLAQRLDVAYQHQFPLFLSILGGALYLANHLLPNMSIPLQHDFIQIHPIEQQGQMDWRVVPQTHLQGRDIVILDELLDDGKTLQAVIQKLSAWAPASIKTVVLCNKSNAEKAMQADYVCFDTPLSYVFGCGLSINGFLAHLPDLYVI